MNIQEQILKKVSTLIEKKNYKEAKSILLNFINTTKNIKIDLKFFYALYLTSNALKEEKDSKKYLEKCIKKSDSAKDVAERMSKEREDLFTQQKQNNP